MLLKAKHCYNLLPASKLNQSWVKTDAKSDFFNLLNLVDDKWQKIIKFGKNHELICCFIRGYLVSSTTLIFSVSSISYKFFFQNVSFSNSYNLPSQSAVQKISMSMTNLSLEKYPYSLKYWWFFLCENWWLFPEFNLISWPRKCKY